MIKRNILECMTLVGKAPSHYEGAKTYVSTGAVDCDHIDYKQTEQVTYDNRPSRANLSVTSGDILFAKMCGTKKTLRINDVMAKYLFSTGFCAVRANESVMIADLLYHLLSSEQFLTQKDQNSSGATQKAITNTGLKKITIQVPDLEEQRVLAAKLDCIEQMMAKRRIQIEYFDQLVKSRFVEMFGDPTYNPKGYKIKKLSQLGELNRGVSKARPRNSPELLGGPYPLVQTGEVTASELYINTYENTYSEKGLAQSRMWPKGTLCITIAANIAQTAILNIDACFPDSVVGFIPGKEVTQIYMHYWFTFFQKILEEQAPQVAQKNINLKILNDLDVMVPERTLQEQFEKLVNQTDKSKYRQEKCIGFFQCLEKSIRQEWL